MSFITDFLAAHGGLISTLVICFAILNAFMSFVSSVFHAIGKTTPGFLGTVASVIAKATDFLSANVAHTDTPAK